MYKKNLRIVIEHLQGKVDIYDNKHNDVIKTWDNAWDEMKWMGYNPESVDGIKKYIKEQL